MSAADDSNESRSGLISARKGDPRAAAADDTRRRVVVTVNEGDAIEERDSGGRVCIRAQSTRIWIVRGPMGFDFNFEFDFAG